MNRLLLPASLLVVTVALAGCGSSTSGGITIPPAAKYELTDFQPSVPVPAGKPTTVSFVITKPNGKPLTRFKSGSGPHTGVHLIMVRRDLAYLIHKHPPIAKDGTVTTRVTFPAPGPYRVVVDVYPKGGPLSNFQLFDEVTVAGKYVPQPLPAAATVVTAGGNTFTLDHPPSLKAINPADLKMNVTDAAGRPARFTPWYGALAHAIFFRQGSLDYFHTHVCAPGASGCTSVIGPKSITGSSATPGHLNVGVLVPAPGLWRLFLQTKVNGKVVTAPFTLRVT